MHDNKGSIEEMWKIFEVYLHYLVQKGIVKPDKSDKRFQNLRMAKFLNEAPVFSKDKRGMSIPILIVQVLFYILHKDYDNAMDRVDAMSKYCSRYLKGSPYYRSNIFMKMLIQLSDGAFRSRAAQRIAQKYIPKLKAAPLQFAEQTHEIEIIPYEHLWHMAIGKNMSNLRADG